MTTKEFERPIKNRMSEAEAEYYIRQYKKAPNGLQAFRHVEKHFDTNYLTSLEQIRLIETYLHGFYAGKIICMK
jgi:hypothetical protein